MKCRSAASPRTLSRCSTQVDVLLDRLHAAPLWNLPNSETLTFVKSATSVAAKVASVRLRGGP